MKTKPLLLAVLAVSLILIFAVVLLARSQSAGPVQPGHEGRIVAEQIHLSSKVPGRISAVYAKEGMLVEKGDLLARLHMPELLAKRNQAEGALQSARAQYEMAVNGASKYDRARADASLEAALAQYQFADSSMGRLREMYSDSLIAAQEYEEMLARYRSAKAQLDAARILTEDLENGTRPEKTEMAKGDVTRAESALEEVAALLEDAVLRAPRGMVIESISLKESELAPAGYTIISGYDPDDVYVRLSVPESEAGRFAPGNNFAGKVIATGEEIDLTVESVRALPAYAARSTAYPNHSFDESWFEIRMRLSAAPAMVANGLRVIIK